MNHAAPQETVFIPRYPVRPAVYLATLAVFSGVAIWAAADGGRQQPLLYLGALGFPMATLIAWTRTHREIILGTEIVAKRYLLPSRVFQYADIRDVGRETVRFRTGTLRLGLADNARGFIHALHARRRMGSWSDAQISGMLNRQNKLNAITMAIALPTAAVLTVIVAFIRPLRELLPLFVWFLVLYLPIALVTYVLIRRRSA